MLTYKDIKEIEKIFDKKFDEKLKFLPSRNEFFGKMAEVMKELGTIRDELAIVSGYRVELDDHEERINKLEESSRFKIF